MNLSEKEAERLSEIAGRFGIRLIALFGSVVKGMHHAGSDIPEYLKQLQALLQREQQKT